MHTVSILLLAHPKFHTVPGRVYKSEPLRVRRCLQHPFVLSACMRALQHRQVFLVDGVSNICVPHLVYYSPRGAPETNNLG